MLLYSDESNGAQVSLKYAWINGSTLSAPVTIQDPGRPLLPHRPRRPAGRRPARRGSRVWSTPCSGGGDTVNGAYYYELPAAPGGGPTPDAAAGN